LCQDGARNDKGGSRSSRKSSAEKTTARGRMIHRKNRGLGHLSCDHCTTNGKKLHGFFATFAVNFLTAKTQRIARDARFTLCCRLLSLLIPPRPLKLLPAQVQDGFGHFCTRWFDACQPVEFFLVVCYEIDRA